MTARRTIVAIALVCASAALAGCGARAEGAIASADRAPAPARQEAQAGGFRLAKVAGNLGDALYVTAAPGQPSRLYVVQQSGRIRILERGRLRGTFLDISGLVTAGGEQGLLGLAFHPRYARNGRFFVYYTNRDGDQRVVEYRARAARADPERPRAPDDAGPVLEPQRRAPGLAPTGSSTSAPATAAAAGTPRTTASRATRSSASSCGST